MADQELFEELDKAGLSDLCELFADNGVTKDVVWELDDDMLNSTGVNLIQKKRYEKEIQKRAGYREIQIMKITSTGFCDTFVDTLPECWGRYGLVTNLEQNGFPVWKHEKNERYLLCSDYGYWSVKGDIKKSSSFIKHADKVGHEKDPSGAPKGRWKSYDEGWHNDDKMKVVNVS